MLVKVHNNTIGSCEHDTDTLTIHILRERKKWTDFQIEIFHEQLPLPVPCYDLLPVTELTLGR